MFRQFPPRPTSHLSCKLISACSEVSRFWTAFVRTRPSPARVPKPEVIIQALLDIGARHARLWPGFSLSLVFCGICECTLRITWAALWHNDRILGHLSAVKHPPEKRVLKTDSMLSCLQKHECLATETPGLSVGVSTIINLKPWHWHCMRW